MERRPNSLRSLMISLLTLFSSYSDFDLKLIILNEIKSYSAFKRSEGISGNFRSYARRLAIAALAPKYNILKTNNWIRFPYYHHVFDDERKDFARQLRYLKNFGDFISMDEACDMIKSNDSLNGRYFCVSFDDGFLNCRTNMVEVTSGMNIPVIIYLPTDYIGLSVENEMHLGKIKTFYQEKERIIPFLSWEDCKDLLSRRVSFGSHTCSHANLARLTSDQVELEMINSKKIIEEKLAITCHHFACPWGRSGLDFLPEVTTKLSKQLGYRSFATTNRGAMKNGGDLYLLKRDHLIAGWENFQLKFFFGK